MKIPSNNKAVMLYFWRKVRSERLLVFATFLLLTINVLLNKIIPPIILAQVLNKLARNEFIPGNLWGSFGWMLVLYTALMFIGALTYRVIDICVWKIEARVEQDIANETLSSLLSQSARFHSDRFSGSLVSQSTKLLSAYVRFADTTVYSLVPLVLGIVFSIIVLLRVAPLFALVLSVFSVLYVISAVFISRKTRRYSIRHAMAESYQTGVLADSISNVMAVKSFANQRHEEARFAKAVATTKLRLNQFFRVHQKQQLIFGGLMSGIDSLSLLMAVLAVMAFGADAAVVFLILSYTAAIGGQLFSFSNSALKAYSRSIGDATDMVEIIGLPQEIVNPATPEKVRISRGAVAFKDVIFSHNGANTSIFDGLSLHIKPGEKVGLVGHSGSGKTTLTRLLLRLSDIQKGTIAIDGQSIAAITQDDLRRHIAYVPQEPLLFHRTIKENIAYGKTEANQAEIEAIAKKASAHEFIQALPQGYDTLVGERGVKLSGGQRQRIAIARAMLKDAPLLVLDEATSALDSESEVLIQAALWKLMEGRTAIVIAHRLSTIQKMDRIIVLDNGKIVEQGSHKELLGKSGGTYAKLWAHQSGGFIEE